MITIARHQLLDGFSDAKYLIVAGIILLAFLVNGFVYSEMAKLEREDWQESVNRSIEEVAERCDNLQRLAEFEQRMIRPPSALLFIADDGGARMPNVASFNAFWISGFLRQGRDNEQLRLLPAFDWSFIIGTLMTLLTVLIGYGAICGEKQDGTLRLLLSNPVSRLKLFAGKYIGLLGLIVLILLLGALLSVSVMVWSGALPTAMTAAPVIGWSLVLSCLCLSLVLLFAMAVSSIFARPVVALIVLMICWIVFVVAIPGMGRLLAESIRDLPSPYEREREETDAAYDLWESAPPGAGSFSGDPNAPNMHDRMTLFNDIVDARQRIRSRSFLQKSAQVRLMHSLSSLSPMALLAASLQQLNNTGVYGYDNLVQHANRYRRQLHEFVVEKDGQDPDSAHWVYCTGRGVEWGMFSTKPLDFAAVPRWQGMWLEGGLPRDIDWPGMALLTLLMLNVQMAILAFIALYRYDPR